MKAIHKEDNRHDSDILSEGMMKLKIESNERIRMKELEKELKELEKELKELEIQKELKELEIQKELKVLEIQSKERIRELEIQSEERIKIERLKSKQDTDQNTKDFAKEVVQGIKAETFIKKRATQLSSRWYNQFLSFSTTESPSVKESEEFVQFVRDFEGTFNTFLDNLESAHDRCEKYVQSSLELLMDKIFEIFFNINHCQVSLKSRDVITEFDNIVDNDALKVCHVTGIPDGSILWRSVGIHVWEVKNQDYNLDGRSSESLSACAQIAIYMKYDIEMMWRDHSIITDKTMGIISNGSSWILVIAVVKIENSKVVIQWKNSDTVFYDWRSDRNLPEQREVLYMIFLACRQSQLNLNFLVESSTNAGYSNVVSSGGENRQDYHHDQEKEPGGKQNKENHLSGEKDSGKQMRQSLKTLSLTLDNIQALNSLGTNDYESSQQLPQWFEKMLGKSNRQVITMTTEDLFEKNLTSKIPH